ncbi:uncharacterized protein LOC110156461 isoform X2 [Boleophthalmus pectinirostris]|uniref:uncharacterized protein LOC110156461 isoform X2 n=1 Tax=Boleophthalmus pectinirostris TaxID=150288 RepID=UPI00243125D9|nr:uncharacterized protein LOC110156461 isoform X2 [Boleophthalmus pectinirostris]
MARLSSSRCHCSVPLCSANQHYQPYLSFHNFPTDTKLRARWVRAIRRDEGADFKILPDSSYVCSLHFTADDIYITPKGRRRLKKGTIPTRFAWKNWGQIQRPVHLSVYQKSKRQKLEATSIRDAIEGDEAADCEGASQPSDHDYAAPSPPGSSDLAPGEVMMLQSSALQELKIAQMQTQLKHFCASDSDFRFYTNFPSEKVFMVFWESVYPSASRLVYWTKAQRMADPLTTSTLHSLTLIDECFLFFCRIAAGLKEKVLGAQPMWMSRRQVQATMPEKFRQYCLDVRVIIDCTKVHCETPSAPTHQSEPFSSYKNSNTFKSLIGIAPCGVITFVSKLYTDFISDKEITEKSNLISFLQPGDEVVAHEGFIIHDLLAKVGAKLTTPPFENASHLSTEDALKTQAMAHLRVLVEKAIRRVKEYHIWDRVVPLSLSGTVNQLWTICCLLTHYQSPLDTSNDMAL